VGLVHQALSKVYTKPSPLTSQLADIFFIRQPMLWLSHRSNIPPSPSSSETDVKVSSSCSLYDIVSISDYIVTYGAVARQRPQNKQRDNCNVYSRCYAIGG
jgi:hypothetical protein